MGLELGWLRAAAQGYNYSYNKIELGIGFQKNPKSWRVNRGWGLDGWARWRRFRVTFVIILLGE